MRHRRVLRLARPIDAQAEGFALWSSSWLLPPFNPCVVQNSIMHNNWKIAQEPCDRKLSSFASSFFVWKSAQCQRQHLKFHNMSGKIIDLQPCLKKNENMPNIKEWMVPFALNFLLCKIIPKPSQDQLLNYWAAFELKHEINVPNENSIENCWMKSFPFLFAIY